MSSVAAPKFSIQRSRPQPANDHPQKRRTGRILMWIAVALGILFAVLTICGYVLSRKFEPFVREHTAAYLRERFDSELSWSGFHLSLPMKSPLSVLLAAGRGAVI